MITGQAFELLILQLTVAPVSVYARVDFATQSTSSESTTRINPEREQPPRSSTPTPKYDRVKGRTQPF